MEKVEWIAVLTSTPTGVTRLVHEEEAKKDKQQQNKNSYLKAKVGFKGNLKNYAQQTNEARTGQHLFKRFVVLFFFVYPFSFVFGICIFFFLFVFFFFFLLFLKAYGCCCL